MITRGGDAWLWKSPSPLSGEVAIRCDAGDTAVAFDAGALLGSFSAGEHRVSGSSVDVFFVRQQATIRVGTRVTARAGRLMVFGEARLRITDPVRLIAEVAGVSNNEPHTGVEQYAQREIGARLGPALVGAAIDQPGVKAALDGLDRSVARGIELDGFPSFTVKGPTGDVTVNQGPAISGPTPGSEVWALWTDGEWHPATVREVGAGDYLIQWDASGYTARLPLASLKPR